MREVVVRTWCDYPGCRDNQNVAVEQETYTVEFWVYTTAKGRKTQPITVELCEEHRDDLRALYQHLKQYDQKAVD
jgi:hypothetical protein